SGGLGFVDVVNFVLPEDRDLTGQLRDCDGVAVATTPPAPAADGRGTDRAVPCQQLRDRDRSCAAVAVFWSCHRVLPLGLSWCLMWRRCPPSSRSASAHGRFHQG